MFFKSFHFQTKYGEFGIFFQQEMNSKAKKNQSYVTYDMCLITIMYTGVQRLIQ